MAPGRMGSPGKGVGAWGSVQGAPAGRRVLPAQSHRCAVDTVQASQLLQSRAHLTLRALWAGSWDQRSLPSPLLPSQLIHFHN